MADLVTPSQLLAWPGVDSTLDAGLAESLLDQIEELFERSAGRSDRPFKAAQLARTERKDGTGTSILYLDYSITVLTSVKLGYNVAVPDETLVVTDQTKLVFAAGDARLVRVDGGKFGDYGQAGYVHVTYDAAADLPTLPALAIVRVAAAILDRTGLEALKSERLGAWGAEYGAIAEEDSVWQAALDAYRVVLV